MAESDKNAATESSSRASSSDELIKELQPRVSDDEQNEVKGGGVNPFLTFYEKANGDALRLKAVNRPLT